MGEADRTEHTHHRRQFTHSIDGYRAPHVWVNLVEILERAQCIEHVRIFTALRQRTAAKFAVYRRRVTIGHPVRHCVRPNAHAPLTPACRVNGEIGKLCTELPPCRGQSQMSPRFVQLLITFKRNM